MLLIDKWVRWFWGLTCDFWAENAENKCKGNKQKQIPPGDDNKKGSGTESVASLGLAGLLGAGESMVKDERRGRYGFAKSAKGAVVDFAILKAVRS